MHFFIWIEPYTWKQGKRCTRGQLASGGPWPHRPQRLALPMPVLWLGGGQKWPPCPKTIGLGNRGVVQSSPVWRAPSFYMLGPLQVMHGATHSDQRSASQRMTMSVHSHYALPNSSISWTLCGHNRHRVLLSAQPSWGPAVQSWAGMVITSLGWNDKWRWCSASWVGGMGPSHDEHRAPLFSTIHPISTMPNEKTSGNIWANDRMR